MRLARVALTALRPQEAADDIGAIGGFGYSSGSRSLAFTQEFRANY